MCFYPGNFLEHSLPTLSSNTNIPCLYCAVSSLEGSLESSQEDTGIHRGGNTCLESHSETEAGAGPAPGVPSSGPAVSAWVPAQPSSIIADSCACHLPGRRLPGSGAHSGSSALSSLPHSSILPILNPTSNPLLPWKLYRSFQPTQRSLLPWHCCVHPILHGTSGSHVISQPSRALVQSSWSDHHPPHSNWHT